MRAVTMSAPRPRRWRAGAFALVAVIAATVAIVLAVGRHGASPPPQVHHSIGPAPLPPARALHVSVVAHAKLPGVFSMALAEGSLWVTRWREGMPRPLLLRLDPRSLRPAAAPLALPVNALGTLTVRGGAVYVDARRRVLRIGPSVARVRLSRQAVPRSVRTVFASAAVEGGGHTATGLGAVWVAHTNRIVRIDGHTGERSTLHPSSGGGVFNTAPVLARGAVWVAIAASEFENTVEVALLEALKPGGGRAGPLLHLGTGTPTLLAVAARRLWVVVGNENSVRARLWQVDPATERIVGRPVKLPADFTPSIVASQGRTLWMADVFGDDRLIELSISK